MCVVKGDFVIVLVPVPARAFARAAVCACARDQHCLLSDTSSGPDASVFMDSEWRWLPAPPPGTPAAALAASGIRLHSIEIWSDGRQQLARRGSFRCSQPPSGGKNCRVHILD